MGPILQLLTSLAVTFGAYGAYYLARLLYAGWTSPLNDFPGPPNPAWIYGNIKQIFEGVRTSLIPLQ